MHMTTMKKPLLAIGAACVLALSATPAGAEGDGLELGPVHAFPALTVTETWRDNFFLAPSGEESDWVTTITPSLRFALPLRRFLLQLGGQVDVVRHAEFDDENATNWSAKASVGADFPGGLSFEVAEEYRDRYQTTTWEHGPGERAANGSTSAKVGYAIRDALRVDVAWRSNLILFDDSTALERTENSWQGTVSWRFRPRISALAEVAWADYAYDSNKAHDNTATRAALGATWDFTSRSSGVVKAGYEWKRYAEENPDDGVEDASTYTVSAGVRHAFSRRTSAELDLTRTFEESDFPGNPHLVRTEARAGVTQRFTHRLRGSVGAGFRRAEYPKEATYVSPGDPDAVAARGERTDNILTAKVSLAYALREWLEFELAADTARSSSNFDTFEYTANQVSLGVRAAF